MTGRSRGTWVDGAALGLFVVAGCTGPGIGLDDEGETTTGDGDGDGDTTGDGDGDNGVPLELTLAKFNATGQFLLLRFSEPMAPVDAVDPSDFRVSFARTQSYSGYYGEYNWSFYADPGIYYSYNYYDYTPLVVTKVSAGNKATDIVLRFENALDPQVCAWLAQLEQDFENNPSLQAEVALFPHYSPGAVPVESLDGEALAPIGPDWVEYDSSFMNVEGYGWPNLDPQVEIPCEL